MIRKTLSLGFLVLFLGCEEGGYTEGNDLSSIGVEVAPQISDDWIGYDIGASPGRWFELGQIKAAPPGSTVVHPTMPPDFVAKEENNETPIKPVINVLTKNGKLYRVEHDDVNLELISSYVDQFGLSQHDPNSFEFLPTSTDEPLQEPIPLAFSNGDDNRIARGIGDHGYSKGTRPYRYIGRMGIGCTGTFIQCKDNNTVCYYLTVAHCLFNSDGEWFDSGLDISPRRDDNADCGTKCSGTHPYGRWKNAGAVFDGVFYSKRCYDDDAYWNDSECPARDMAIVKVTKCSSCSSPGWIKRSIRSKSKLANDIKKHRGYPKCHKSNPPVGCKDKDPTLYGDGNLSLGNFFSKNHENWYRLIKHSSDTSSGHSGGPMYISLNGNYYIFGVNVYENDCSSNCGQHPNGMRRITPYWNNLINAAVTQ
ncbi:MAG: hypothetical protein GY854_16625 [Deltaproteobacteria bacterium]|nr:hypothetical protein [Deltaproteobacteria bacterium]